MQVQAFLDLLFARAKREGIDRCEAYLSQGDAFEASVNAGEIIDYNVSSSTGLGFRALIGGKMGYASTQALDEAAVELLIEGVKESAALIESGDEQFLFAGSAEYAEHSAYNPALDEVPVSDKLRFVKELEQKTLGADPRIARMDQCVLFSNSATVRIVNSMGLDVSHRDNMICAAVFPVAQDGSEVNTGMEYQCARDVTALDLDAIARDAAADAASGLHAKPVPSGRYKIVLGNTAAAALLSRFSEVFSADNAQKGLSLLKGKEGEAVASGVVTLMDDPFHPDGFSGAPFDAEGVASYAKAVIDKGVLTTLLHNLKTAKKQNLPASTANAGRGSYAAPVSVAPSNFYFAPGTQGLDALLKGAGDGLLITDLQGLHAANTISGDFSLSARGFLIENGTKGRPVSQITVSGNFYALLRGVAAVGSDLRFSLPGASGMGSPSLLVDALSVAGE